jgi:hypothetical protein
METKKIKDALRVIKEAKDKKLHCFEIVGVEDGVSYTAFEVLPRKIDFNGNIGEYEYTYAIQEIEKDVMALRVGESMYFQPCRDDKTSKAIILRIV